MSTLQGRLAEVFADQMFEGKPQRGLQADIARLCGVSRPTVSAWFNNVDKVSTMERVFAEKICARYRSDISPAWLAEGLLPKKVLGYQQPDASDVLLSIADLGFDDAPHEGARSSDFEIVQFDTGGAMGHGVVLRDQPGVIKSWTVSDSWLQQNVHRITAAKNLCIVTGFGPSMQPLFNPGDPLLVDRGANRVDVDGVYFFRVGTEGFVKQLQRIPTATGLVIRAKSYNTLYDPFDITEGMDFEVFGRVVKVWRGEEF